MCCGQQAGLRVHAPRVTSMHGGVARGFEFPDTASDMHAANEARASGFLPSGVRAACLRWCARGFPAPGLAQLSEPPVLTRAGLSQVCSNSESACGLIEYHHAPYKQL